MEAFAFLGDLYVMITIMIFGLFVTVITITVFMLATTGSTCRSWGRLRRHCTYGKINYVAFGRGKNRRSGRGRRFLDNSAAAADSSAAAAEFGNNYSAFSDSRGRTPDGRYGGFT